MTCRTGHAARLTQFANGLTQRRITFGQTVLERIVKAPVHHLLHRQVQAFGIKKSSGAGIPPPREITPGSLLCLRSSRTAEGFVHPRGRRVADRAYYFPFLSCCCDVLSILPFIPPRPNYAHWGYGFVCSVARTDAQHRLGYSSATCGLPRGGAMRLARATNAAGDENRSPDKALTAAIRGQT